MGSPEHTWQAGIGRTQTSPIGSTPSETSLAEVGKLDFLHDTAEITITYREPEEPLPATTPIGYGDAGYPGRTL